MMNFTVLILKILFFFSVIQGAKLFTIFVFCFCLNKKFVFQKSVHIFPDDVNKGIRFLPIKLDCKYIITPELEGICRAIKLQYAAPGNRHFYT